jgi:DNA topoisomerase-1
MKLRYQLFTLEPKLKRKRPDLAEDESDMDDEFMARHEDELKEKALDSARKRWEKDNIKLEEGKEETKPLAWLNDRLKEIEDEFTELAQERKTKKVEPRKNSGLF